jgi:hypothetical protein
MENAKQPINPVYGLDKLPFEKDEHIDNFLGSKTIGLTKGEYFAGLAMQGLMSNPEFIKGGSFDFKSSKTAERVSSISIKVADELLKQIENNGKG